MPSNRRHAKTVRRLSALADTVDLCKRNGRRPQELGSYPARRSSLPCSRRPPISARSILATDRCLQSLDTDFIRTGLHAQLSKGMPPRSIRTAQGGSLGLFMEYDTLLETNERLPKFADELGASVPELRRILNEDWLPTSTWCSCPQVCASSIRGACESATVMVSDSATWTTSRQPPSLRFCRPASF